MKTARPGGTTAAGEETLTIETALRQAGDFLRRGELARAEQYCTSVLATHGASFEAMLLLAMVSHRSGRHHDALAQVRRALELRPESADALAQQGLVLAATGSHEAAVASYDEALAWRPGFGAALYNRANSLQALGRHEEALAAYDRLLSLDPGDAGALNNRGVALFHLGRQQDALDSYARSLAVRPGNAEALNNRGNALGALGFREEALRSFDQALAARPDYPEALSNQGNALHAAGRTQEALESLGRALRLRPDYAEALNNRASVLLDLDRPEDALADCQRALALQPQYPEALSNRGNALQALGRHEEALASHERAFAIRPGAAQALNLGDAQHALGHHEDALLSYDMALTIRPDYAEAWNNRGNALQALNRHEAAIHHYQKATELRPDDAEAHWNEGLARLAIGDYRGGWAKYEWRLRHPRIERPRPFGSQPAWLGREDAAGKTVLLYTEQGFGDAIQFIRYAPLVTARGARVIVACHESLAGLFRSVEGVDRVITDPAEAGTADLQAPLMSLPYVFRTSLHSIPGHDPYLRSDPGAASAWRERIDVSGAGLKVGIAWTGNPRFPQAHLKACPLDVLQPLFGLQGVAMFSLQKGEAAAELAALGAAGREVADYTAELADFGDTAALMSALDLVISVDTAVAHLAGALGRPVWILLPQAADWRWLREREDSPWYPSARLFRQARPGDWTDVVERVRKALEELASSGGGRS